MREIWLNKISRKKFNPTTGHRVCSAHFLGGEKTYDNNIPTIVPKRIKISEAMTRTTKTAKVYLVKMFLSMLLTMKVRSTKEKKALLRFPKLS